MLEGKVDEIQNIMIEEIVSSLVKKFGKDSSIFTPDIEESSCGIKYFISTGNIALDTIIGGGIPSGRLTEIFGNESSGKSIIGMQILANTQKMGGVAVYIDTETTFDADWSKKITDIDSEKLIYSTPDTVEDINSIIDGIVEVAESSKDARLITIVVDSIAATSFKREMENVEMGAEMSRRAQLWSQSLRKITRMISRNNIALIFINQVRDNIGVLYGAKYTTPGGNAIRFHSSVRIELHARVKIEDSFKNVLGVRVQADVIKNKIAPPFKKTEFSFTYENGISKNDGISQLLINCGALTMSGGWLKFSKRESGFRESELENIIKEFPELLNYVNSPMIEKNDSTDKNK